MNRPRGTSTIHLILAFVLIFGLIVLAYFAGTATCDGPHDPRDVGDASGARTREHDVYGYVSVEPRVFTTELLLKPTTETADYTGLSLEQRTHAALLKSRTILAAAISNPALKLRNTKWFKSFKHPIEAQRWLERHFHADIVRDSKLIVVWLDPIDSSREARTILIDIVNTHLDEQRKLGQAKMLDHQSALNTLRIKCENRIRELADRRNNLLLRMNVTNAGSNNRTTSTDVEFSHAVAQHASLTSAAASAKAKHALLQAEAKDDANRADVRAAEAEATLAAAALDASYRRIESLRSVLGDISIAMNDYLSVEEELVRARAAASEVRAQLDMIQSSNARMSIDWAQHPTARDAREDE